MDMACDMNTHGDATKMHMLYAHAHAQILPQRLSDFVYAPMPYILGVHTSYMPDEMMVANVVVGECM